MEKVFYHVVTEKPMELGQLIVFDAKHHSGVYERVYNLESRVNDIYNHHDEYLVKQLDYHLSCSKRISF